MRWARAVLPVIVVASLGFIDVQFVISVAKESVLIQATTLELAVFGLQICKTVAAFVARPLRNGSLGLLVDYYGAEVLLLPIPALGYLLTNDVAVVSFMGQLIIGWLAGAAFAILPFAIYRIGVAMYRSGDVSAVVPVGIVAAEVALQFAGSGIPVGAGGLRGVLSSALLNQGAPALYQGPDLVAMMAILVALFLYTLLRKQELPRAAVDLALAVGIAAVLGSIGWVFASSSITDSFQLAMVAPTVAIVGVVWWVGRAKK